MFLHVYSFHIVPLLLFLILNHRLQDDWIDVCNHRFQDFQKNDLYICEDYMGFACEHLGPSSLWPLDVGLCADFFLGSVQFWASEMKYCNESSSFDTSRQSFRNSLENSLADYDSLCLWQEKSISFYLDYLMSRCEVHDMKQSWLNETDFSC